MERIIAPSKYEPLSPEFEENKRQHEERKKRIHENRSCRSSTGETESNDDSEELLDQIEEIDEHNSPVKFSFLKGKATNEKLFNEKGKILNGFRP